jgi:hypothetical protein
MKNKIKTTICGLAALLGVALGTPNAHAQDYNPAARMFIGCSNYNSGKISGDNLNFNGVWPLDHDDNLENYFTNVYAGINISNQHEEERSFWESNCHIGFAPYLKFKHCGVGLGINWQNFERDMNVYGISNNLVPEMPVFQTISEKMLSGMIFEFHNNYKVPFNFRCMSAKGDVEDYIRYINIEGMGYGEARTPLYAESEDSRLEIPIGKFDQEDIKPLHLTPFINWKSRKETGNRRYYRIDDWLSGTTTGMEVPYDTHNEFNTLSYGVETMIYGILNLTIQQDKNERKMNGISEKWDAIKISAGIGGSF